MRHSCFQPILTLALTLASALCVAAQGSSSNAPARVFREKVEPNWFAGADGVTTKFWYRVEIAKDQREFILANAAEGRRAPAFDHARVAEALGTWGRPQSKGPSVIEPARLRIWKRRPTRSTLVRSYE